MDSVIAKFFENYSLLPDYDAFRQAQSELMLPSVHVDSCDHRGWQSLDGVDSYVASIRDWMKYYTDSDDRSFEQTRDDGTNVEVRVHGTIVFREPINGVSKIKDADHNWHEVFVIEGGKIAKARIDMGIKPATFS
jgi:hypothetical protein